MQDLVVKFIKANDNLALKITMMVGTVWCTYLFAAMTLVSLPEAIHGGIYFIVQWVSTTFLQLVLLSIIMIGTNKASEKSEQRAEQDHVTIMAEFLELKDMHNELRTIVQELQVK